MCGSPVGFDSAQYVSAHPIFGVLFDQDDCCVLCSDCLSELEPGTRAAALRGAADDVLQLGGPQRQSNDDVPGRQAKDDDRTRGKVPAPRALTPGADDSLFPKRDPDGGLCA